MSHGPERSHRLSIAKTRPSRAMYASIRRRINHEPRTEYERIHHPEAIDNLLLTNVTPRRSCSSYTRLSIVVSRGMEK